jgi:hypothetical protein
MGVEAREKVTADDYEEVLIPAVEAAFDERVGERPGEGGAGGERVGGPLRQNDDRGCRGRGRRLGARVRVATARAASVRERADVVADSLSLREAAQPRPPCSLRNTTSESVGDAARGIASNAAPKSAGTSSSLNVGPTPN